MKKFRFSLRSVATLRKLREGERRERFSAAVHVYAKAEEAVARVSQRIIELEDKIALERAGRFRAADQLAFMQELSAERVRKTEAQAEATKAKTAMETERQAWLDARRDVRLVDILETKARVVHRLEHEREEQAALDDRTNALFARAH